MVLRMKPKSEPPPNADPEEYERFLKTAHEVGASDDEAAADRAFKRVVKKPVILNPKKHQPKAP